MQTILLLGFFASFFALCGSTGDAIDTVEDRVGQDESEDGNILLWQELMKRIQRVEKNRAADLQRIRKLEDENKKLRSDLDRLLSSHAKPAAVETANGTQNPIRRRRLAKPESEEKSVEFLPAAFQTASHDDIIEDVHFLDNERPAQHLTDLEIGYDHQKLEDLSDQVKRLADRVAAVTRCCNRTGLGDQPDDRRLGDPSFPTANLDQLRERVHHTTVSLAQMQQGQYEMRDQQKWLIFQIEQISNELGALDEDRKKLWAAMGKGDGVDNGGVSSDESSNNVLGESSGEADASGWQSANFVDDAVIVSRSDSPRLQDVEKTAKDAYSIVTQLKTKLDIVEKDLSKLTGMFKNLEKTQLSQSELNTFLATIDFVQEALLNVTSRLLENEIIQEKYNTQFQNDLADVTKRLRQLALQTEKAKHLAQVVKDHQIDHFSAIQQFRQDLNALETNVLRLGMKLTNFQTDVLNATLASYKDSNKDLQQDVQIADLYTRIDRVDGKFPEIHQTMKDIMASVRTKAERAEVKNIGADVQKLGEKLQMTSELNGSLEFVTNAVRVLETQLPTDCSMSSVPYRLPYLRNGTYVIKPKDSPKAIVVYCQFDTTATSFSDPIGWTVIQKRTTGREDFNRSWEQYRHGFGDPKHEYWLGNEYIHMLTRQSDSMMRIDAWDIFGDYYYAEYGTFKVASYEEGYRLDIGQHSGNLTDALQQHSGMKFSAFDLDADTSSTHCARYYSSGWWFSNCQKANLNGPFPLGVIWFSSTRNDWLQLQRTVMKVRPIK